MQIRQLDNNGDWTFGQGKSNYLKNNNAIALNIQTRYNEWVGDCFFNVQAGIDWINRLGFSEQNLLLLDIKRLILQSFGVVQLLELSSNLSDNRVFTVNYSIKTIYSPSIEGQLVSQGGLNA